MNKIKRSIAIYIVLALAIGFNTVPAEAYVELQTPVKISASGTLVGTTIAFTVNVVAQQTGTPATLGFETPSGVTDSGEALKIKGGTNQIDSRVIIYTDNTNNTVPPNKAPTVNPNTGVDGSGLVGQINAGYTVPLIWGVNSAANYDPNINVNYVFDGNMNDGIGEVYIVDKRHTHSFTTPANDAALDNPEMYKADGTLVPNTDNDDLYPQLWAEDLYNAPAAPRTVLSEALYKTIATTAFGISTGAGPDAGYYICNVPKLTTASPADNVVSRLSKADGTAGGEMYIYIGADFTGAPAQVYSTAELAVAIVQS